MAALINWLQDMYIFGQQNIQTLDRYHKLFAAYPELREALEQHSIETRQQVDDVHECLAGLHTKIAATVPSRKIPTPGDTATLLPFADTPVQYLAALYASEQFSYACYAALAESARQEGAYEIADICERIAEQEIAMAEWVEEQLPPMVGATLRTKA
jgi:ferritin-like metal-binding protein YciE